MTSALLALAVPMPILQAAAVVLIILAILGVLAGSNATSHNPNSSPLVNTLVVAVILLIVVGVGFMAVLWQIAP